MSKTFLLMKINSVCFCYCRGSSGPPYVLNLLFQYRLVLIVNKPTKVTKNNAILIDCIITYFFTVEENLTAILKTDIFDHFSISSIYMKHGRDTSDKKVTIRE